MSLFCGIYSADRARAVPPLWRAWMRTNLSRQGFGTTREYAAQGIFLAHLDVGAFEGSGWCLEAGFGVSFLTGDTLLAGRSPGETRDRDLARLHSAELDELPGLLRGARGNHCVGAYRERDHALLLATDRLGFRPVYWLRHDGFVLFAGAKRLLEQLPDLQLTADLRGAIETACFGFALADRTEYSGLLSLRGGSVLRVTPRSAIELPYWDWAKDACADCDVGEAKLVADVFQAFVDGVRLRRGKAHSVFAGLSGGLDTRCVVAALRFLGSEVTSINVSWQRSLDQTLGGVFASVIGSRHVERTLPLDRAGRDIPKLSWETMRCIAAESGIQGPAAQQLWGGNDGSISAGYVYIGAPAVAALRSGSVESAAARFLSGISLVSTPFPYRRQFAGLAADVPLRGVTEELQRAQCPDPAQALFLFLLENHQRRMLAWHFEEIDQLPFEHVEPFFDSEFLSAACRIPVDLGMRHRFYHLWLSAFPPAVAAVPWQSYPGHEECPLPLPAGSEGQWGAIGEINRRHARRRLYRDTGALLRQWRGSGALLSRPRVLAALLAGIFGVANTDYILQQANRIGSVLEHCDGRVQSAGVRTTRP